MATTDIAKFTPAATTSNSVSPSSGSAQASSSAIPNPLSNVEQPSYHWKFYMGSDIGNSSRPIVTIAETGKTSLNITDVEILYEGIAPNFQTKNMGSRKFTIKISEPLGMTLPDKLLAAANYANVKNFLKAPYFISVDFLGYDPESGTPTKVIERTWTWRLMINKLTTDMDSTGGRHTIEGIAYHDLGTTDLFSMIQFPTKIDLTKAEAKVGDVMEALAKQINANIEKSNNKAGGGIVPLVVEIKDIPYKGNAPVASPFEHKVLREVKQWDTSRNQEYIQIARGTDMGRLVDYLMSASETATQMINPADSSTANDSSAKEYATMHRVESHIENTDYNTVTQDYVRKVTFYIIGQDSVRPISSAKSADDAAAQGQQKKDFLISKNYMKKQYDWIFTGKNTEVINFNLNLNFDFAVAKNLYDGYINSNVAGVGIEFNPDEKNVVTQNLGWLLNQPAMSPLEAAWELAEGVVDTIGDAIGDFLQAFKPETDVDNLPIESTPLPTSFIQQADDQSVGKSVETNSIRNRSIYSMILNQMYGLRTANLNVVDLEIRGDPYWLGTTENDAIDADSTDDVPNFLNGEHVFVLEFKIPQGMDEEGKPILISTDTYSGYYAASAITHKFSGGQFTQNINAVRIPAMSITKLGGQ